MSTDTARPAFDVNRINKMFWAGEFISLEAALELVKSPREGVATHPFKRPGKGSKKSVPTPKKLKSGPSTFQQGQTPSQPGPSSAQQGPSSSLTGPSSTQQGTPSTQREGRF
jgi:hypothetical protein